MSETFIQINGKEDVAEPTILEQVWGFNDQAKYGTLDEDVYRNEILGMNRSDLETHARRVGVMIVEGTARLQDNLLKAFRTYKTYLYQPAKKESPKLEITDDVRKILAEGR